MIKKVLAIALALCLCFATFSVGSSALGSKSDDNSIAFSFTENQFVKCAENSLYELYVIGAGARNGEFYVKAKNGGTAWYSNPQSRDFSEAGLAKAAEASSQFTINLYSSETGSIRTINSFNGASKGKNVVVNVKNNGFSAAYTVNSKYKITLNVELTDKGVSVSSEFTGLNKTEEYTVSDISLLPYFNAAKYGDEGYSLVPDGSGALIYNNTKNATATAYSQRVYGDDLAFAGFTKSVLTETAALPVFGAKNNNSAFLAVIDEGAHGASINAASASSADYYNRVYAAFEIVASDTTTLGESGSGFSGSDETYAYETPVVDKAKVSYLLLGADADYVAMASTYRDYLGLKDGTVSQTPTMFLELYGGINVKQSVLGIPLTLFKKLTTVKQAGEIVSFFDDSTNGGIAVSYRNLDSAVISGKIQNKFRIKGSLGSKAKLNELKTAVNGNLFLENNMLSVTKGGNGFSVFNGAATRINRNTIKASKFNLATTGVDKTKSAAYAIKATVIDKVFNKYFKSVQQAGFESAFINLANTAYSDFTRNKYVSRGSAITTFTNLLNTYGQNGLVYAPNAYALGVGKYVVDAPTSSSSYDIVDVDVPFYELVLNGVKEYATTSINLEAGVQDTFLKALESGAALKYTFVYDNITAIKNTSYEYLYGADFTNRKDEMLGIQQELESAYSQIGSRVVVGHTVIDKDVRVTQYASGKKVVVNFSDSDVQTAYGTVAANGYIIV